MALSVGNGSSGSATSGTTLTISHTCAAGSNLLIASCYLQTAATVGTLTATYNGVAMTAKDDYQPFSAQRIVTFYLENPPTGAAYNVVFTSSKTIQEAIGVNQDFGGYGSLGTAAQNSSGSGTASTLSVACETNDYAYVFLQHNNANAHTPSDGQTEVADITVGSSRAVAGYKASPAASQSMASSWAGSASWLTHGFAIKPANTGQAILWS